MTLQDFSGIFGLLAVQLRFVDADEVTIRGYYQALKDLDLELIAMAAQRFGKGATLNDKGEAWFPKAPEWRALAGKIEGERSEALKAVLRKLPQPLCVACQDTGWTHVARIEEAPHSHEGRWTHCDCRRLRRLEILGRRPMPLLPEHAA